MPARSYDPRLGRFDGWARVPVDGVGVDVASPPDSERAQALAQALSVIWCPLESTEDVRLEVVVVRVLSLGLRHLVCHDVMAVRLHVLFGLLLLRAILVFGHGSS